MTAGTSQAVDATPDDADRRADASRVGVAPAADAAAPHVSAPHVSALRVHPLKSAAPLPLDEAHVDPWGLRGDRRWMLVETDGQMVTARKDPLLLHVTATPAGGLDEPRLRLAAPGRPALEVTADGTSYLPSTIWGADVRGRHVPAADAWLAEVVGRPVRLLWCDDPQDRQIDLDHAEPGETVVYQDGFPLLLTTTASLGLVQRWVDDAAREQGTGPVPLTMARFRPNVVVDGALEPLVEQGWDRVRIGEVTFRMAKHCGRCVMTTYDPVTLAKTKEPLRSIAAHNTIGGRIVFGVNLVPESTGTLHLGDPVVPSP
ncbi:MOSC domain-containing protein [Arsenicicoccus dermatophilus]|uniref:MOSC domain-containing protein n=1 Tax=Arsenicicoccus dermatophilus TaxID=1076331 RepID=UPI001F4C5559|nr:MOSC N-terminal beta barrel domain-containing protein [Arsenicicoccus dermatophilus]MCH8613744.1 MOSC domain-containing protein [Arsenicicoccus dermatophilus]